MNGLTLIAGAATLALLGVGAATSARYRRFPEATAFTALLITLMAMTTFAVVGRARILPKSQTLGGLIVCWMTASVLWAVFAFEYTGRGPTMTRRRVAGLLVLPVLVPANTGVRLFVTGPLESASFAFASVLLIATVSMAGFGVFLVLRSAISYDDLPSERALLLSVVGTVIALLAVPASLETAPLEVIANAVLLGTMLISITAVIVQRRNQLFESGPRTGHLARKTVLDQLSASVYVIDRERRILDVNHAATSTFDIEPSNVVGRSIDTVLGVALELRTGETATLETVEGHREFELSCSSLTERHGTHIGHVLLFRDVTEQRTHEQRLEVLNRVLRHNLRNELDAVRAFAETLGDGHTNDEAIATRIHDISRELVNLGTTVERAERLLACETLEGERINVAELAHSVTDDVADRYSGREATVSSAEERIEVWTDREILEAVLTEIVDNALKHTDASNSDATVRVEQSDENVVVAVRDTGPGIPEHERAVLLDGEETPLRHGSGLGLWLVHWGATRLGADLSISDNEPSGSVVVVRLPD